MLNQDTYFFHVEGDAWFKRNKDALAAGKKTDWPEFLLGMIQHPSDLAKVLELGCANGWRLNALQQKLDVGRARCVGVDASAEAIEAGKQQFPRLTLLRGVLTDVPLQEEFDLVIVNFVLHWVDRSTLARSVSEIDRLVRDDGLLILGDFLPDAPQLRPYHHAKDQAIYTFKQDYAKIFEALGTYRELARVTFNHDAPSSDIRTADASNRGGCILLKKSLQGYYQERR